MSVISPLPAHKLVALFPFLLIRRIHDRDVKLLLKKPPLLLLDEPTNYLDMDTLDWLEGFLKNYAGAILVVSHDQYFLDHLANQIFELQFGTLTAFKGNYSQYIAERKLRDKQQQAAYEKQQEEIKKDEDIDPESMTTYEAWADWYEARRKKIPGSLS